MMKNRNNDDRFNGSSLLNSYNSFKQLKCINDGDTDENNSEVDHPMIDEDKMRCHILDCMVALCTVQKKKRTHKTNSAQKQYDIAKDRVFVSL